MYSLGRMAAPSVQSAVMRRNYGGRGDTLLMRHLHWNGYGRDFRRAAYPSTRMRRR